MTVSCRLVHRPSGDDCGPAEIIVDVESRPTGISVLLHMGRDGYRVDLNHAEALADIIAAAAKEGHARSF